MFHVHLLVCFSLIRTTRCVIVCLSVRQLLHSYAHALTTHSSGIDDPTNFGHQQLCRDTRERATGPARRVTHRRTNPIRLQAFPGGNFDPKQDTDFRMTALRETFEESGILVEPPSTDAAYPTTEQRAAARLAIHSRIDPLTFPDFLARHHLSPPIDRLVPFSHWTTPEGAAVRFHTRFYVLFTDGLGLGLGSGTGGAGASASEHTQPPKADDGAPLPPPASRHGDVRVQNPTADGGVETISASWIRPKDLFAAFRRAEIALFPPQYYLLTTLGDILDSMRCVDNRTEALRTRIGGFGSRPFNPRPIGFTEEGGAGQRSILTYEGDELRGGKAQDRHRCLIRYQGRVSGKNPKPEAVARY